jgi:hypothetical protein
MFIELIDFICNPKIILFIGIILAIIYFNKFDKIYFHYQQIFYIGSTIVSLITMFGMGKVVPKLKIEGISNKLKSDFL